MEGVGSKHTTLADLKELLLSYDEIKGKHIMAQISETNFEKQQGILSSETVTHLNAIENHHNGWGKLQEHVEMMTLKNGPNNVNFEITMVEIEDGGDGLFGAAAHQLLYGAKNYFKADIDLKKATNRLRDETVNYFVSHRLASDSIHIEEDITKELQRKGHFTGKNEEQKERLINDAINSFGANLKKPGHHSGQLLVDAILIACNFKISSSPPGLIILESTTEQTEKHIVFLFSKQEDLQHKYFSVISVEKKH